MPVCCAGQNDAFKAFGDSIQAVGEQKQQLSQVMLDAKRQLSKVQTQVKSMVNEAGSIKHLRDSTLESLKQAEERLAFSSQASPQAQICPVLWRTRLAHHCLYGKVPPRMSIFVQVSICFSSQLLHNACKVVCPSWSRPDLLRVNDHSPGCICQMLWLTMHICWGTECSSAAGSASQ